MLGVILETNPLHSLLHFGAVANLLNNNAAFTHERYATVRVEAQQNLCRLLRAGAKSAVPN